MIFASDGCVRGQRVPATELPDSPGVTQPFGFSSDDGRADASAEEKLNGTGDKTHRVQSTISANAKTQPDLHRVVRAGAGPQPLTGTEKFEMSFRSRVSLGAFGSSMFGAGERQLFNSRPHYGTDSGAFGERLGAAELKQVTESFFSYGLYAAAFREDPHYYRMGPQTGYVQRGVYSATRVFLTRTDSGNTSINWAKLAGMASATALTYTYYPDRDRSVGESFTAYGSSLATSALTLELHEFMPDVFALIRHRKKPTD